ncbi:MAG: TrkH family potassium uptake protein [bacterium]
MVSNYRTSPEKIILVGYITIILVGTLFLTLPVSVTEGNPISFIDALFTSTSAVCVTGLIVRDTELAFTSFGQSIILILLQLGGLGYMTISTALLLLIGKNMTSETKQQTQNEYQRFTARDIKSFVIRIIQFTFIVEAIGAVILFPRMHAVIGSTGKAVWYSVFHSVSAFCNAGFSVFSNNLLPFMNDPYVNIVIALLIITGGLGFIVLGDIFRNINHKRKQLSVHTRIVLITTLILIVVPFIIFLFLERNNSLMELSLMNKISTALFQVITPRTAGFNTLDIPALSMPALFLIIMLMFIGGSPGSTAGGIKTTTFFTIVYAIFEKMRGKRNVNVMFRRISTETILKSFFIFTLSIMVIFSNIFLLTVLEKGSFIKIIFEVFSAYGTVGLSTGSVTGGNVSFAGDFTTWGKFIIIITMFTGRVGILTAANAFISKSSRDTVNYPDTKIIVG